MKNYKLLFSIIFFIIVLSITIVFSYSYIFLESSSRGSTETVNITTGLLGVTYTHGDKVETNNTDALNVHTDWDTYIGMDVTSNGTIEQSFSIIWDTIFKNTIVGYNNELDVRDEFTWTLYELNNTFDSSNISESLNGSTEKANGYLYNVKSNDRILSNENIDPLEENHYVLKVHFNYKNDINQFYQKDKEFNGNIAVYCPNEYERIEYIETDGNSYIDLAHSVPTNHIIEINGLLAGNTTIFGSIDGTSYTNSFYGLSYTSSESSFNYSFFADNPTNHTDNSFRSSTFIDDNFHVFKADGDFNYYIDNEQMTQAVTKPMSHWVPINHSVLFGVRTNSQIDYASYGSKISYYKEYDEDGELLYNLVASRRTTDGVIGFYDTLNGKFYTNSGTGNFKAGNVPNGYIELEYIESTGTQYINTGVIAKSGLSSKIGLSVNQYTDNTVLGARNSTTRLYLAHLYQGFCLGYGNYYSAGVNSLVLNNYYDLETKLNSGIQIMKSNGNNIKSLSLSTNIDLSPLKLYLFALNYSGSPRYHSKVKIYYCDIYDNNVLVRRFIPSIRKSDNEPGLYDTVNNTFYENLGTGSFKTSKIPKEYQEVEYIESSGAQYIDTAHEATINTRLYVKGCSSRDNVIGSVNLAGAGSSGNPFDITSYSSANKYGGRFGSKSTGGVIPYVQNEVHEFEISNGNFSCDGINYPFSRVSSITNNKNITLFGITGNYGGFIKIYRSKIYENNILNKDFVPCYRKSDNVAGMIDIENNVFYTNSGTGDFIVGEIVS